MKCTLSYIVISVVMIPVTEMTLAENFYALLYVFSLLNCITNIVHWGHLHQQVFGFLWHIQLLYKLLHNLLVHPFTTGKLLEFFIWLLDTIPAHYCLDGFG